MTDMINGFPIWYGHQPPYKNKCGGGTCYVLSHTYMPAVLVETGFVNYDTDREWLEEYPGKFGTSIGHGIRDYIAHYYSNSVSHSVSKKNLFWLFPLITAN